MGATFALRGPGTSPLGKHRKHRHVAPMTPHCERMPHAPAHLPHGPIGHHAHKNISTTLTPKSLRDPRCSNF